MNAKSLKSWLRDAPMANEIPPSLYMDILRACLREMQRLERLIAYHAVSLGQYKQMIQEVKSE